MEGVRRTQSTFWKWGEGVRYYFSLKETNRQLAEENVRLVKELEQFKLSAATIVEDSTISDKIPEYSYTLAKVVRNSTDKMHNYIIIDKGSIDGIKEDMGVITPKGIVGYVHSVGKHYSMVVSFLNIDNSVSAIIKSNGTFGPLRWNGRHRDKALLHEIPLHTVITPGDTIVTSGYSSTYPAGIPIGTIESSRLIDGINYDVTVNLFLDYSSLHFVYIADNVYTEELNELNESGEDLQR